MFVEEAERDRDSSCMFAHWEAKILQEDLLITADPESLPFSGGSSQVGRIVLNCSVFLLLEAAAAQGS